MADSPGTPRQRLIALVEARLAGHAAARPVSADDELSETGLTSLDMVNLMLAIEAEFDFTFPPADITPATFHSIATIEAVILKTVTVKP